MSTTLQAPQGVAIPHDTFTRPPGVVPKWDGVVMIIRPDPMLAFGEPGEEVLVDVVSARSSLLGGRRAIKTKMFLRQVQRYFRSSDEDHVFVRAELHGEHLQLHERCSLKEWAETAHVSPTQLGVKQ